MFPNGVSEYVDSMQALIPGMKDGTIRTAIDTGCGVSIHHIIFIRGPTLCLHFFIRFFLA